MKKKLLTLGLSSTLALSSIMPAFANTIPNNEEKTYIETLIGFKYPERPEDLKQKDIKAKLSGNGTNLEIDISQFLDNANSSKDINGYNVSSEVTKKDGKITYIKFKIQDLKASGGYNFTLEGKNYAKTVLDLSTADYSKRINITTATSLVLGDVNNDNKVDKTDIKLLEDNLNTNNTDLDLNNDGKITVADIAIVNSNTRDMEKPEVFDTDITPTKFIGLVDTDKLSKDVNIQKDNNLKDIFYKDKPVTFLPKEGTKDVVIPLEFKEKQELSSIEVTIPSGAKNVEIVLEDENGNIIKQDPKDVLGVEIVNTETENIEAGIDEAKEEVENEENQANKPKEEIKNEENQANKPKEELQNSQNNNNELKQEANLRLRSSDVNKVVTINLGKRVPVKKITIKVTPNQDGGFVVVDEVKFLKDVVTDDIVQNNVPTNVVSVAGDKQVSLSWREVPNVTGYKVYYGTNKDNLDKTITTDVPTATISGLDNLTEYYFMVTAISGNWESKKSQIVSAIPQPESAPDRPDFVKANGEDKAINVTWKKAKNAKTYNIYIKTANDDKPKKVVSNITGTSHKLTGLTNDIEYTVYVSSQNSIGESALSEPAQAIPESEVIKPPILPTRDRIPNNNIEKVQISHEHNYDMNLYPNGFDPKWLIDGNFETSWVARRWSEPNYFTFTFKEPKDMDYLIWVPRLDKDYRKSFSKYDIEVWTGNQNLNDPGTKIATDMGISARGEDDKYFVFDFPKQEKVKQIKVKPIQWDGSPTNMSASEVAFYEYNDIGDRVASLFANGSRTALASGVTEDKINKLKQEVEATDGFVISKDILLKELNIALSLVKNNNENLGVIKENVISIDPQQDVQKYGKSVNNWQPLGVVGQATEKITIFADIPQGETVQIIPTQYFEQADALTGQAVTLKNGRNVITIPKIGTTYWDRGGSLYMTYSGNNPKGVKLQVVGGTKIPYLELNDLDFTSDNDKTKAEERIKAFIEELTAYVPELKGNLEHQVLNQAEISLPNVLLSLPANKVLEGIKQDASDINAQVEKVYQNSKAWEELIKVLYKTYGIDDVKTFKTRQNIRYMKMFAGAFMYAAGNHVGIQYGSVAPLLNGKPTDNDTPNKESNNLFGWGIGHEIGHIMDIFGKPEITNNIYSIIAQTYDGKDNTLKSRLELNNVYEKAFKKVSVGGEGVPNDLFTHLTMYWQLHLAYDEGGENSLNFYNEIHKKYRDGSLNSFTDMDKFAVASSQVAKKDLTEFFTRWGVVLSEQAKTEMTKAGSKEERAIYYLTDESRRARLKNIQKQNISVTAKAEINPENEKEVIITINGDKGENVQGFEIIRNGKSIGFTTTTTYKDFIGSANNMAFTYEVVPIDILGNISPKVSAGQVKISYDNTIPANEYTISDNTVTFNKPTIVTGIKLTPKDSNQISQLSGTYKVYANIVVDGKEQTDVLAKNGSFSKNASSKPNESYIGYFNKEGSEEDKIWAYDVKSLKLESIDTSKYNVEFISYPGDNVEFAEMGIGRLTKDYKYGDNADDVIAKDTLVIVGKYRGNSALSNIYVKGKFAQENSLTENPNIVERELNGYSLMFDTLDKDGKITSSTSEGIFIFVPDIQKEAELQGVGHEELSVLPTEIMAEMWITDSQGNKQRMSSNTTWITMPTDNSLPNIEIK